MRGEVFEMRILTALLLCAVSGFEIYYTKGVRFLFKIYFAHIRNRNPPQCNVSPEKMLTG